ncbi:MAG: MFS transporter [Deltaproteobacteria bacterium]
MGILGRPPSLGVSAEAAKDAPAVLSKKATGRWVLAATILGASMAYIDGTAVNVALPALQDRLGATITEVQWVIEAYTLFLVALILTGGVLGDRFGRRLVYGIGAALFMISSVLCGLAVNVDQLIAFRALQGIGGAMLIPGSLAIITAYFGPSERGKAIGTWSAFSAITTAVGPVLGGWLIENASWRWIFLINLPIALAVIVILFLRVPESRGDTAKCKFDYWGTALATAGLGGLIFGLIESSNLGLGHPLVTASILLGASALIAFVIVEGASESPMVPLSLFRSGTFSAANAVTLFMYGALGGTFFFLPFALIQVYGYTATGAGAAFLPIIVILFVFSRWAGGLVDRYGARMPLAAGTFIGGAGYLLIALLQGDGSYFTTFLPGVAVLGAGLALSVAPLTTAVMNAVRVSFSGTASGINNAVSRVAGLVAIAVLGVVILHAFNGHLDHGMDSLGVHQEVKELLDGERIKLAGAEIPAEVGLEMKAALEGLVRESYVKGFSLILYTSAALSFLCTFIALAAMRRREEAEHPSS